MTNKVFSNYMFESTYSMTSMGLNMTAWWTI